jgi:hypothetical protein
MMKGLFEYSPAVVEYKHPDPDSEAEVAKSPPSRST